MNTQAFTFFIEKLSEGLPDTEFIKNWPEDNVNPQYPFASVMTVSSLPSRFAGGQEFISREGNKNRYKTATWLTKINLHYFYQKESESDQAVAFFQDFFNTTKEGITGEVQLRFGDNPQDICQIRLMDWQLDTGEGTLRKGERRLLFSLEMESITTKEITQPVIKKIEIDAKLSEKPEILNG